MFYHSPHLTCPPRHSHFTWALLPTGVIRASEFPFPPCIPSFVLLPECSASCLHLNHTPRDGLYVLLPKAWPSCVDSRCLRPPHHHCHLSSSQRLCCCHHSPWPLLTVFFCCSLYKNALVYSSSEIPASGSHCAPYTSSLFVCIPSRKDSPKVACDCHLHSSLPCPPSSFFP